MLNRDDRQVLAWLRKTADGAAAVVACNFSAQPRTVGFDFAPQGVAGKRVRTLPKTQGAAEPASLSKIELPAFGVYIGRVER